MARTPKQDPSVDEHEDDDAPLTHEQIEAIARGDAPVEDDADDEPKGGHSETLPADEDDAASEVPATYDEAVEEIERLRAKCEELEGEVSLDRAIAGGEDAIMLIDPEEVIFVKYGPSYLGVRRVTPLEFERLRKANTRFDKKSGRHELNQSAFFQALVVFAVRDWRNVRLRGEVTPFSKDLLKYLPDDVCKYVAKLLSRSHLRDELSQGSAERLEGNG